MLAPGMVYSKPSLIQQSGTSGTAFHPSIFGVPATFKADSDDRVSPRSAIDSVFDEDGLAFKESMEFSPEMASISCLPDDAICHIAGFLGPSDRLSFGLASKRFYKIAWECLQQPSESQPWRDISLGFQENRLGRALSEKYASEKSRRNIGLVEEREIVLKTFFNLCMGCEEHPAGPELITGLSLCKNCVRTHPYLGVTSRTSAKREYMLTDDDLSRLGDRSAVIEYDSQLRRVYRVHFYRRALFKKATMKFGGVQGFLQQKERRSSIHKKRSESIAIRRNRRRQEIEEALRELGLRTRDVYAAVLPVEQRRRTILLPWEIELDNAAHEYTNRKQSDPRLASGLARATAVKVFFRDRTNYAPIFHQDRERRPHLPMPNIQANAFAKSLQEYFSSKNATLENWEELPLPGLLREIVRSSMYSPSGPAREQDRSCA